MLSQAAKTLRQLDDEIISSLHRPKELLIRRNSFTPLCRLPPEIIARVLHFTQVASSGSKHCIKTPWVDFDVNWVECTRVCRRLRDVALETPDLWTFIVPNSKHELGFWAQLCAERSKGCLLEIARPLYCCVKLDVGMVQDINASAEVYLDRAKKVHTYITGTSLLSMSYSDRFELYMKSIEMSLPFIEHFSCDMESVQLRPGLLGGSSGSLTRLTLVDVVFGNAPTVPSFPVLLYLELDRTVLEGVRQFTTFLSHTPRLEHLAILRLRDHFPKSAPGPIIPVSLPHLHTLHMSSQSISNTLHYLLSVVPRPQNCYIEISNFREQNCEDVDYLLRFLTGPESGLSLPGCITWSNNMGSIEIGTKFEVHSPTCCPRVFYTQRWSGEHPLLPSLAELVDSVHFVGQSRNSDHVMKQFGSYIRHMVVENVLDVAYLPPGFDDWVCERANAGHSLETLKLVRCGEWLCEYAEELEKDGMVIYAYLV